MFFNEVLQLVERMRAADVNLGILPNPKFDENQDGYYHIATAWCMNPLSIPVTNKNLERTGFILEAMAAEAMYTLTPAFYNVTLQGKYIRDNESSAMLDIILNSRIYTQDELFAWGMHAVVRDALGTVNMDFVSKIESSVSAIQTKIDSTVNLIVK